MSTGIVGVIANDFARASLFTACVWKLDVPEGWRKEMLIGGDWCGARNDLCRVVLDDPGAEYLFFMDDDHAFPRSMLTKLLAHEKDIVMPICLTRTYPFTPVQYVEKDEDSDAIYLPVPLAENKASGLIEVEAGGAAGMLIHRRVIEAIEPPWFEYADRSEDIIFCEKAKAAGFTLWADLTCRLGHITTAVVEPAVRNEEWHTAFTIGRDLRFLFDTAENLVSERPGRPAMVQTWVWEARNVITDDVLVRLYLPAGTPFNVQHVDVPTPCTAQWYCDEGMGGGFKPVGEQFTVNNS